MTGLIKVELEEKEPKKGESEIDAAGTGKGPKGGLTKGGSVKGIPLPPNPPIG